MLKNNIHGQLFKLGVVLDGEVSDLFSPKGRHVLQGLRMTSDDRAELERKLALIDDLSRHIAGLDPLIERCMKKDKRARWLKSLPGVGDKSAYAVLAEVGDFARFPNGRALASYAGLVPMVRESAEKEKERHTNPNRAYDDPNVWVNFSRRNFNFIGIIRSKASEEELVAAGMHHASKAEQ